jgi:CDP-4-dehydro-6-deoxyglucose reductase
MLKINLSNGKFFNNVLGQTLLESAKLSGLVLEHSCRTGRCGVCKARVLHGETQAAQSEEALTQEDIKHNVILTCCRTAVSDVELDIEDLGDLVKFSPKIVPCRIDNLHLLSADVIEVTLRTPPSSKLEYLPGQYVDVIGRDGLRRSYSIANAPKDDGKITLQIRKVANGLMSRYWFEEASHNDLLRMEGPLGTFCLRNTNAFNLILLATGTGIAPIKAILEQLSDTPSLNSYRQIHLYWGGRTQQDLYWNPDFPELRLKYTPVLSRATDWNGAKGYVHNTLLADQIELGDAVVFACGSEAMINSAREQLTRAGLKERNFYSDAFVSAN